MCRNIRTLANFEPPATEDEIRASALQFVRKLSGTSRPSRANEVAFNDAVDEVAAAARRMLDAFESAAPPRDREVERRKARARAERRFGPGPAHEARVQSAD
jgi:hypothetical protein